MKQEKKTKKVELNLWQPAGAVLCIIGIALLLYNAYLTITPGTLRPTYGAVSAISGSHPLNGSVNSSQFGLYHGYAGTRRSAASIYPMLSGLLMLLLGVLMFKYGGLKKRAAV